MSLADDLEKILIASGNIRGKTTSQVIWKSSELARKIAESLEIDADKVSNFIIDNIEGNEQEGIMYFISSTEKVAKVLAQNKDKILRIRSER